MKDILNIALIQANLVWENSQENLNYFDKKIDKVSSGVDLVVLPEMFTTGFSMNPEKYAEKMEGETVSWIKKLSKEKEIAIVGSLIIKDDNKYYNRLVFVHPNGKIDSYDKRHLFTYGGENKVYSSGNKRLIVEYKGWKICPMICYDIRFPVWSRNNDDYELLIYVANWPKPRISAWDILLKARAIENMCYTIGVNRVGVDGNNIEHVGHSQVIDMLGKEQIYNNLEKEVVFEVSLDKNKLTESRNRFRFLNDKDSFSIE
ncbi:MAG: amidohydrolase [Lutibacter sp.]|nr:MAG: amidohydrolase [Lutibacter sp.]